MECDNVTTFYVIILLRENFSRKLRHFQLDCRANLIVNFPFSCFAEIIAPHLIWHAGRTAESVRTMAAAALCSLAQGTSPESARKVVESLMVPLVSLIDDHNIATRSYTLKTLENVGPLKYEQLRTLAPALLSRLDDPGNEVREKAAKCLGRLELTADDDDALDSWETLLKQILSTMLLHLESPEINLRAVLIESTGSLAAKYQKVYREAFDESTISPDLKRKLP
jgi:dynein assembly factor 5, axonemal